MIRIFKILQNFKDIFKKKIIFFKNFRGAQAPPWSSSGSATGLEGAVNILGKELPLVGNSKPTLQINCESNPKPNPLRRFWACTMPLLNFWNELT